jgi:hypothetical protein
MAGLFGGGQNAKKTPRYTQIQLQTSAQGVCIPIVWGRARIGTNLIWYGDFKSYAQKQKVGKGGLFGGGSASTYYYYTAVIMGLCEGPIQAIGDVWASSSLTTLQYLNLGLAYGGKGQAPWSYMTAHHPTQALGYTQTAYVFSSFYSLGTSPSLPSHNFEVVGFFSGTMPGTPDVNPADVIQDMLTNVQYGLALPTSSIADLTQYKTYCTAQGLFFSPALTQQEQLTMTFQRWAAISNSWIFWSGNQIKIVPLGDSPITNNGVTYTPTVTPIYNLTLDDFVQEKGAQPLQVTRSDPADGYNQVQLDIKDRSNAYNSTSILVKDQTSIDQYGELMANIISAEEVCDVAVANIAAQLILKRSVYIRNTYQFKTGYEYVLLEPGDIITLTEPNIGLLNFPVRIKSVQEDSNGTLAITAEEFPAGIGTIAQYTMQTNGGAQPPQLAVDPGPVNAPALFEPSAAITNGQAQIWVGLSGGAAWGGAYVYLSFDGNTYSQIGIVEGASSQGVLLSALPSSADPDTTDTLAVDLTESVQVIPATATDADANAFRTLALVDNEVIAYGSAAPGTADAYAFNLTYLRRGVYGTPVSNHPVSLTVTTSAAVSAGATVLPVTASTGALVGQTVSGAGIAPGASVAAVSANSITLNAPTTAAIASGATITLAASFTRLDQAVLFVYDLPAAYVGQPIYLKFTSFNQFGNGIESLADVQEYIVTPLGVAFQIGAPGVPTLTPSSTTQADGTTILTMNAAWTASAGPLLGSYQVEWSSNGGTSWSNASTVGADTLTAVLAPALASTNYLARVRAVSQNGQAISAWATSAPTNSGALVTNKPAAPTAIAATAQPGAALVSWTASATGPVSYYQAYYGTSNAFSAATPYGVTTTGTGLTISGLTGGTLYYFWVVAVNGAGTSAADGPVTATPTAVGGGGVSYSGTNYPNVAAGANVSLSGSGDTLTISSSGGSGGSGGGGINFGQLAAPTASETFLVYAVGSTGLTLNANLPGFAAYAETAPSSNVAITLLKNGTSIGTINWAAGVKAGTTSFASTVTFASGDVLTAVYQATADATFANFGVVIVPVSGGGGGNTGTVLSFGTTAEPAPSGWNYQSSDPINMYKSIQSFTFTAGQQIEITSTITQENDSYVHAILLSADGNNFYMAVHQTDKNCMAYQNSNRNGYFSTPRIAGAKINITLLVQVGNPTINNYLGAAIYGSGFNVTQLNDTTLDLTSGVYFVYVSASSPTAIGLTTITVT